MADMRTGRYHWLHDANERTQDRLQVGSIRFPTSSCSLWLLAFLGVTHYLWIQDDGSCVVYVGPKRAQHALLRISNDAATRNPSEAEITAFKESIHCSKLDQVCSLVDKFLFFGAYILLAFWHSHSLIFTCLWIAMGTICLVLSSCSRVQRAKEPGYYEKPLLQEAPRVNEEQEAQLSDAPRAPKEHAEATMSLLVSRIRLIKQRVSTGPPGI